MLLQRSSSKRVRDMPKSNEDAEATEQVASRAVRLVAVQHDSRSTSRSSCRRDFRDSRLAATCKL